MDQALEKVLSKINDLLESQSEISISSPEYNQNQIDHLIDLGYLEKIDVSTLSGWNYIIKSTYSGKNYFENKKADQKAKLKHNIIEILKFIIPTIISIITLIVSIFK